MVLEVGLNGDSTSYEKLLLDSTTKHCGTIIVVTLLLYLNQCTFLLIAFYKTEMAWIAVT